MATPSSGYKVVFRDLKTGKYASRQAAERAPEEHVIEVWALCPHDDDVEVPVPLIH